MTKYQKRSEFWFSNRPDQGATTDQSIKVRFNDGGHANISGGISWELPLDEEHLNAIQAKFNSQQALEQTLVRKVVEKSVYMTGPMMSSKESYAERRNDLLQLVEDQVQGGVIRTRTVNETQKDPVTGLEKVVAKAEPIIDANGKPVRAEESPLTEFGIRTFNLAINEIKYEDTVENQIKEQQSLTMKVQTSIALAKQAEQKALTVEKEGQATAAQAKWEQMAIKAKAVTEAEQKKEVAEMEAKQKLAVAELDTKSAEQFKLAETLRGEGEAARRRLVMEADGALEKKLDAWIKVNEAYAKAMAEYKGSWVPGVVMGSNGNNQPGAAGSGATDLVQLLTVKAAKDLALDFGFADRTHVAEKSGK